MSTNAKIEAIKEIVLEDNLKDILGTSHKEVKLKVLGVIKRVYVTPTEEKNKDRAKMVENSINNGYEKSIKEV